MWAMILLSIMAMLWWRMGYIVGTTLQQVQEPPRNFSLPSDNLDPTSDAFRSKRCTSDSSHIRIRVVLTASEFAGSQHRERAEAVLSTWGKPAAYRLANGDCVAWEVTLANEGSAYTEAHGALKAVPGQDELTPPPDIQKKGRAMSLVSNLLHEFRRSPSPDWIFKVDDCVFVLPENAAKLFGSFDATRLVLLGGHLRTELPPRGQLFASAAGFALSRGALQKIDEAWGNKSGFTRIEKLVARSPDVGLSAMCQDLGVEMLDTRDQEGAERFNVFPPMIGITGGYHDWYVKYKKNAGHTTQSGIACCAADSVLFHYVSGADVSYLQGLIHGDSFASANGTERLARWPRKGKSLFDTWSYLRPSADSQDPFWKLIEKIRAPLRQ